MSTNLILTLCTLPDETSARKLAEDLVAGGLAACVTISPPVTSIYRWEGRIESGEERLLLIKTTRQTYPLLEAAIRSAHPYELPEIIAVSVEQGLDAYLTWVEQCTSKNS